MLSGYHYCKKQQTIYDVNFNLLVSYQVTTHIYILGYWNFTFVLVHQRSVLFILLNHKQNVHLCAIYC